MTFRRKRLGLTMCGAGNMGVGRADGRVIPRQRPELVLIAVDEYRNIFEIGGNIFDLRAIDELLSFQHAAEQQADDHQHNGDFDQGKTGLIAFHYDNLLFADTARIMQRSARSSEVRTMQYGSRTPSGCIVYSLH